MVLNKMLVRGTSGKCVPLQQRRQQVTRMNAGFGGLNENYDRRKLIIPSQKVGMQGPSKGAGPGVIGIVQEGENAESRNKFLLPKNFMERTPGQKTDEEELEYGVEEMLGILTERTDAWYKLAKYIVELKKEGIGSEIIDDVAGINSLEQNAWVVSSNVFATLVERNVEDSVLDYFSSFGADKLLYPLRVLTAEDRQTTAEYVCAQQLDEKQSEILVRAMREFARRGKRETVQFEYTPGDCLAFKYYRDALEETRNPEKKAEIVDKGLSVATSTTATEVLEELLVEKDESDVKGKVTVIELDEDEFDNVCVAIAGSLQDVNVKQIQSASTTNRRGAFGILSTPKAEEEWVVLPMFQPFVSAIDLVAVTVDDMMDLKDYGAITGGSGVLVLDRKVLKSQIDTDSLYAVSFDKKDISFVSGQEMLNQVEIVGEDKIDVIAKAVMAVKPPGKKEDFGDATVVVDKLDNL